MSIGKTEPKSSWFLWAAVSGDEAAKTVPGLATLATLLLFLAKGAAGQSAAFASIARRVLGGAKGASVSRATVTATDVETAVVRKADTTEDGLYQFDHLTPGILDIRVEDGSFARAEVNN